MSKKEQILDTMLVVVNEQGLIGATISKLSKKANISPGIIYHYFETKDEILHTLFKNIEEDFITKLKIQNLLELPLLECYRALWKNVFYFCINNPAKMAFLEAYKNSPYMEFGNTNFRNDFFNKLEDKNKQSIQSGELKNLPIEVIYAMTANVSLELAKIHIHKRYIFSEKEIEDIASSVCNSIFI